MYLEHDLYNIDKKLLIKSGENITGSALQRIIENYGEKIRYLKIKNSFLLKDIKLSFAVARYKIIFSPESINKKMLSLIQNCRLPEKVIAELKNIKRIEPYTYKHILATALIAAKVSMDKKLKNRYDPKMVVRLGFVHDIGKSRIPANILNKGTPLTRSERKILKTHCLLGYLLLRHYYGKDHTRYDYASYEHHERLDGSGYPRGLKKINKYAQLLAVIDVLDALTSIRPYRATPYSLRAAFDYLLDEAQKKKLNKKIIYILISYARKDKSKFRQLKVSGKKRDAPPPDNVYGKTAL